MDQPSTNVAPTAPGATRPWWVVPLGIVFAFGAIRLIAYASWTEEERTQYRRSVRAMGGFPRAL